MTTQITGPTHMDRLMAALSVAVQVTAESPVVPTHVRAEEHIGFEPPVGVLLYLHHDPEGVRAAAERFGLAVQERPRDGDAVYTYADGERDGVPFRFWALTDAPVEAVTEAAGGAVAS